MQLHGILFERKKEKPISKAAEEEEEKQEEKFNALVERSNTVLLKIKTSKWFDMFPDELIVDLTKVNVIFREFFGSARTQSIFIKDISDVLLDVGFNAATLTILDQGMVDNNTVEMSGLKKDDAVRARRIIQGLVVATKNGINLSQIDIDVKSLIEKIEDLGRTHQGKEPGLE